MYIKWSVLWIVLFLLPLLNAKETRVVAFYTKNIAKVSDKDVQIAIKNILKVGSEKSGIELKEEFPDSVDVIIDGFISGRYSLITLNTYDVMKHYQKLAPYIGKMWTIAKKKKTPEMRYLLLVPKENGDRLVNGTKIALLNFDYMQNVYLDSYLLKNYHMDSKKFFQNIYTYSTASQVILKLFFSKVDACVVSEHAYQIAIELNPQLKNRIKILAYSEKVFPSVGLTISRKDDYKIVKLYNIFSQDKQDIKTLSNVLMLYKAEAIVYFSQKKMDKLRTFYKGYEVLKARYE